MKYLQTYNESIDEPILPKVIYYFGTNLTELGHGFWMLEGERMEWISPTKMFKIIPFNPETLADENYNGIIKYHRIENYAICAITGSCKDTRPGSKTVFWTDEPIKLGDLKPTILSIPIAKKIIDTLPFSVRW